MRIVYDMTQSAGSRVLDVQMRCSKCHIPQFEPLNQTEVYQIVMIAYLADGGGGYRTIPEETVRRHTIGEFGNLGLARVVGLDETCRYLCSWFRI